MSYNIGDFRCMVRVLRHYSDDKDQYGRELCHYEMESTLIPCKAHDVSGRDFYAAATQQMEDVVTLTMRCGYRINLQDRFCFVDPHDGTTLNQAYKIVSVNHLGYRGDFIQYRCRAVFPEAVGMDG